MGKPANEDDDFVVCMRMCAVNQPPMHYMPTKQANAAMCGDARRQAATVAVCHHHHVVAVLPCSRVPCLPHKQCLCTVYLLHQTLTRLARHPATHPLAMHWTSLLVELLHGVTLGQPHGNPFDCGHRGSGMSGVVNCVQQFGNASRRLGAALLTGLR